VAGIVFGLLAIGAGFFVALSDALNKKFFSKLGHPYMIIARTLGSVPFLLPVFVWQTASGKGFRFFTLDFALVVGILLVLESLATLFYMKAIKSSDLSLSIPFLSFTPVFITITGFLILGEKISVAGFLGICLVVAGGYLINLPSLKEGFIAPVKAALKENGCRLMLTVALIYSITSVLGKKAILLSSPVWFASFYFSFFGLVAGLFFSRIYKIRVLSFFKKYWKEVLLVGGSQATMCVLHMLALIHLKTAYMIALKRTSVLFSVILGYLIFRESYFLIRLSSVILMLAGVVFILLLK